MRQRSETKAATSRQHRSAAPDEPEAGRIEIIALREQRAELIKALKQHQVTLFAATKQDYEDYVTCGFLNVSQCVCLLLGFRPMESSLWWSRPVVHEAIIRSAIGTAMKSSHIVAYCTPAELIDWATRNGVYVPIPFAGAVKSLIKTLARKGPTKDEERADALETVLELIQNLAAKKGVSFERSEMPGTKKEFCDLLCKKFPPLFARAVSTLEPVFTRAGCKFLPGVRPGRDKTLRDILPEDF